MNPKHFLLDKWILISFLVLVALGLVMVTSASMEISDRQFGYPFHYFIRQFIFLVLGIGLLAAVTQIPLKLWEQYSRPLLLVSLIMLLLVLIPGIGHSVNGSRRWLGIGFLTIQVSEAVKLCALVYLASYLNRYQQQVGHHFFSFLKPILILGIISVLLLLEPDLARF